MTRHRSGTPPLSMCSPLCLYDDHHWRVVGRKGYGVLSSLNLEISKYRKNLMKKVKIEKRKMKETVTYIVTCIFIWLFCVYTFLSPINMKSPNIFTSTTPTPFSPQSPLWKDSGSTPASFCYGDYIYAVMMFQNIIHYLYSAMFFSLSDMIS